MEIVLQWAYVTSTSRHDVLVLHDLHLQTQCEIIVSHMMFAYISGVVVSFDQYSSSDPAFTLFISDTPELLW